MIQFDEKQSLFHLSTKSSSYVCALTDGKWLGHLYYGKKLSDTEGMPMLFRSNEFPFTPAVNNRDKVRFLQYYPLEYPTAGVGDYRESCLDVKNSLGQAGVELAYKSHRIFAGKPALKDLPATRGDETCAESLEILLTDPVLGLEVYLLYSLFADLDVIARSVRVVNCGQEKLTLTKVLSASLTLEEEGLEVLTLHGSWGRERRIQRQELLTGSISAESTRGESSAEDNPFLALLPKESTQNQGEVWAMNFVYSGNFLAMAQTDSYGKTRSVMGIHPEHFSWELTPGSSFQAPECVLVYSDEGLGKMTRTFHDLYRQHLIPLRWLKEDRPILVNNWEATAMNFDSDILLGFARSAKEAGLDMLVMDDGWFGHRDDDSSSLGDWYVDRRKLKNGLDGLADEVNRIGLKFGLWVEPEMVSGDSDLCRKHPDWMFRLKDREPGMLREQYVLDLTREEVWEGVYSQIHDAIASANIAYVKWDMNRPLSDVGNLLLPPERQGEILHRYVLAVYRMQGKLLEDFPDLLLENCSSGGARFDPGMLYFSPQIWTSDDSDAIERLAIQEGTSLVYPMSTMGAHVSVSPNEQTGRVTPFDTRAKVAMAGTFGYELDVRHLSEEDKAAMPGQIALFRRVHPVVREGDYYRLASYRENHVYDAYLVSTKDKRLAFMTYVQVLTEPNKPGVLLRLQGLDPDLRYSVTCDFKGSASVRNGQMSEGPDTEQNIGIFRGETLMKAGMIIPRVSGDYQAMMYEFRAVD